MSAIDYDAMLRALFDKRAQIDAAITAIEALAGHRSATVTTRPYIAGRRAQIVAILAAKGEPMTWTEIAREIGIEPRSNARMIRAALADGAVKQRVRLGPYYVDPPQNGNNE